MKKIAKQFQSLIEIAVSSSLLKHYGERGILRDYACHYNSFDLSKDFN